MNAYLPNFIYQSQQTTEPKAAATASSVPDEEHRQLSKKYQELKVLHKELRAAQSGLQDQIKRLSLDHQKAEAHIGSKQKQIDELGVQCHVLQRARQADGQEINKLQQQLLVFKRGACASAKVANQLTDDEIRQKIDRVYYATQDLAVTMGRGSVLGEFISHLQLACFAADFVKTAASSPRKPKRGWVFIRCTKTICPKLAYRRYLSASSRAS